jgi:hypothetical protein
MVDHFENEKLLKKEFIPTIETIIEKEKSEWTNSDFMFITCCYSTYKEKYHYLIKQLKKSGFDWIPNEIIDICFSRIKCLILSPNLIFELEVYCEDEHNNKDQNSRLSGRIDCYDVENDVIWEFKCVAGALTFAHRVQLIVYMYLFYFGNSATSNEVDYDEQIDKNKQKLETDIVTGKLFNIRTNELIEINVSISKLKEIIILLCNIKRNGIHNVLSDKDFVQTFLY